MGMRGFPGSYVAPATVVWQTEPISIAVKEMFPVVLVAATFGNLWAGKVIQFVADNMAVVDVIMATYSKDLYMIHFIWLLVFLPISTISGSQQHIFQGG